MASVDPKAVLEGRIPGRPPIGLILGLTISSLCALLVLGVTAVFGGPGFEIGLLLAILPVPLLVSLVLWLDRLEPEPPRDLALAFLWGAGVAVLGALVLNTLGMIYVTVPIFGEAKGHFVSAALGAPVVEESLKGAVLFGLLWFRRDEIDGFVDGIVYAALVAIGFAMMENVTYYMRAYEEGGAAQLQGVFILRGIFSPLGHPLFTSMTGLGVAYAATHRGGGRITAPIAGLLAAMTLHGLWNASTVLGLSGLAIVYLLGFCILIILVIVVLVERRRTVQLINRYLPAYYDTGLVTPQDVWMLARIPARRAARQWARSVGGRPATSAMADYQLAATELVLLHRRAERGTIEPAKYERRHGALLSLMAMARQAFLRMPIRPAAPPWAGDQASGFRRPQI
jgi:RsiW-degrading membrane proteinase PrsW (M82 family)